MSLAKLEPAMKLTCRLFLCARCRTQVFICSSCDRGQIYCSSACSKTARLESSRAAGRRYQQTLRGRMNHAERARRYRQSKNKVTHQGSITPLQDDLLAANSVPVREVDDASQLPATQSLVRCHFCGAICSAFVRSRFLHRHRVPNLVQLDQRGT